MRSLREIAGQVNRRPEARTKVLKRMMMEGSMRYTEKMTGRRVRIVCFSTFAAREHKSSARVR